MKRIILAFVLLFSVQGIFAQKYLSREVYLKFYGETPLETIEAVTNQGSGVIDAETKKIAFQVLVKSFTFEKALMQEHFNENYIESDKFPKATFRGTLEGDIDFNKTGKQKAMAVGTMNIHGVDKDMSVPVEIEVKDGEILLSSVFMLSPEDFNIEIPSVVRDKIAKEMETTLKAQLKKQ
ncbi:MAG: YceI family protein [Bacteroidota bacterium]|nr:YceI family protein [Bacteroidota bacterium]